jgi:ubiquinone/menaquinone biosynthesis C-methylase UbiE
MQKRVISLLKLKEGSNFLDLGCGTGWAVRYVSEKCNGQGNFIGIDISSGMIKKAKENTPNNKNISYYQASSESLPLENEYFDNIICTNSFHHYRNPHKALYEVHRVLKPRGKIYILDVTSDDFFIKWIDRIVQRKEKEHVKFYNTNEYKNMFLKSGLNHIKSKTVIYPLKVHIAEK